MVEVERIMSRSFEWGPCDCCSAVCDVFTSLWGIDVMPHLRGFTGALEAARILKRGGGLECLAETLLTRAGLQDGHAVGGIALSEAPPRRQSLLICIEPGLWAGKSHAGFAMLRTAKRGWHLA